jgi:hypothetical protein
LACFLAVFIKDALVKHLQVFVIAQLFSAGYYLNIRRKKKNHYDNAMHQAITEL